MMMHIGFRNFVNVDKVVSIVCSESAGSKRLIRNANKLNLLIHGTAGRKVRSIIVCESGHVIISAFEQDTLVKRLGELRNE